MIYEIGGGTGVFCIEGAGARVYFITRPEPMLVDTGSPGHAELIVRDLAHIGVQAIHLKKIVLTHHHVGHVGNLADLKRRSGARVCAHVGDAPFIEGKLKRRAARSPVERVFHSAITRVTPADPQMVEVERRVEGEEELSGWRVIHTPGHTPGHICLLRGEILISGDLLQASAGAFREMPLASITDVAASRESIGQVARLEFGAILPGHDPPHVVGACAKVKELAARLGR
jgi:glyoxylase-like metal-dependent hydrolase (beta-lactamase superfamily II)